MVLIQELGDQIQCEIYIAYTSPGKRKLTNANSTQHFVKYTAF